jgi:GTP-binding protein EngB required for normal cell division
MTNAPDPLLALLYRAHREELVPLARRLGLSPQKHGLGDLARRCAQKLRRSAAHPLGFAQLAGHDGPTYAEIVDSIARKRGQRFDDVMDAEFAWTTEALARLWPDVSSADRQRLWLDLGFSSTPPSLGTEAQASAATAESPHARWVLTERTAGWNRGRDWLFAGVVLVGPLGCLARPILPILLPLLLWRTLRPNEQVLLGHILEVGRIRQMVAQRVTIGVVGSPSAGKDAAIRALFGVDSGNISPIAGSTRTVTAQRASNESALFIVNTPGLGDVDEAISEETRQILDHIDVYLYIVNAEGGVQAREKSDYDRCAATGKPVLAVVNKVDVLRPLDVAKYLEDARQKLGVGESNFAACAFDPLPQLSAAPIGVDRVLSWLRHTLVSLDKDPEQLPRRAVGTGSGPG